MIIACLVFLTNTQVRERHGFGAWVEAKQFLNLVELARDAGVAPNTAKIRV